MATFRVVDDLVLSESEFRKNAAEIDRHREARVAREAKQPLDLGLGRVLPERLPPQDEEVAFEPIGFGKPLTIELRHVYTGRFPGGGGLFGLSKKDVAVVSGLKDYSVFAASARALNLIQQGATASSMLSQSAFEDGTPVIAYSPSVVADSLTLTIEFAIDSFPGELIEQVSQGLKSLAGVPMMLPYAGVLLGAGEVVRLGAGLGDALFDGSPAFSITETINFDRPGSARAQADFRILSHSPELVELKYQDGIGLVDDRGWIYVGDEPYIVISLDGRPRPHLADFTPTLASAAVLKRFFEMKDRTSASIEAIMSGMKLASDMRYRDQADALQRRIDALSDGPDKARLVTQREAVLKNIGNEFLRPAKNQSVEGKVANDVEDEAGGEKFDLDESLFREAPANAEATIRVPEPNTPNLRNKTVEVQEVDDIGVFEGDIALYRVSALPTAEDHGIVTNKPEHRWPGGVMPYIADPEVAPLLEAAMRHWEQHTNVRFKKRTDDDKDYVHFKRLNGSWSFVGRQGGMQEASIGASATVGTAIHEIGHALGLWHEQSRTDRDQHVTVYTNRVSEANRHNFDTHIPDSVDVGPYDTNSIMHYPSRAFSIDGVSPTIVTKNGAPIGQRNGVSQGDINAVNRMYPKR